MGGGAELVDNKKLPLLILGAGAVLVMLYLANDSASDNLTGVPKVETEAQFGGLAADVGLRENAGTMLDTQADTHFYVPGYNCPGQSTILTRHRYPVVCGGNISTIMHRGFDAFRQGSPDNEWRVQPPSEYSI
jgi:hypothetical protein